MEGKNNEADQGGTVDDRLAAVLSDKGRTAGEDLPGTGHRGPDAGYDDLYVPAQERDGRGTDVRSGENRWASAVTKRQGFHRYITFRYGPISRFQGGGR